MTIRSRSRSSPRVTDDLGNPVAGVEVAFAVATGGGEITPATMTTTETGTASANAVLGPVAGEQEFTATVPGLNGSPATFTAIAFPPICSPDDWCWHSPIPQGNSMNGTFSLRDDHVWVVGDTGTTLRWNGVAWEGFAGGTDRDLYAVWGAAENDVWAVGEGGVIVHFDGFRWMPAPFISAESLRGVWGSSASDVWAVGDRGTIIHYDGMGWSQSQSPTMEWLTAIHGLAANDVWAVGDRGTTIKLAGMSWEVVDNTVTNEDLNGVFMIATDDVWAVGDNDTYVRWTGAAAPGSARKCKT